MLKKKKHVIEPIKYGTWIVSAHFNINVWISIKLSELSRIPCPKAAPL